MKTVLFAATAAAFALGGASAAQAVTLVQTGVLDGAFNYFELPGPGFDPRPHRVELYVDPSSVSFTYLGGFTFHWEEYVDFYPGFPPDYHSFSYDYYTDLDFHLTPSGFSFVLDTDDDKNCNPYATLHCSHQYILNLAIVGTTTNGPVEYTYKITAIPEPATWALMIAGFGFAGAALRRGAGSRALRAAD